jgi:hypothetical protein
VTVAVLAGGLEQVPYLLCGAVIARVQETVLATASRDRARASRSTFAMTW